MNSIWRWFKSTMLGKTMSKWKANFLGPVTEALNGITLRITENENFMTECIFLIFPFFKKKNFFPWVSQNERTWGEISSFQTIYMEGKKKKKEASFLFECNISKLLAGSPGKGSCHQTCQGLSRVWRMFLVTWFSFR